jgi:hypothetical protein
VINEIDTNYTKYGHKGRKGGHSTIKLNFFDQMLLGAHFKHHIFDEEYFQANPSVKERLKQAIDKARRSGVPIPKEDNIT